MSALTTPSGVLVLRFFYRDRNCLWKGPRYWDYASRYSRKVGMAKWKAQQGGM